MNDYLEIKVGVFTVVIGVKRDRRGQPPYFWDGCGCQKCVEWRGYPLTIDRGTVLGAMHPPFVFERNWITLTRRNRAKRQALKRTFA